LRNLEHNNPHLFAQILAQTYRHLSQADCWIADLSTGGIKPRVARMIDFLSRLEYGESSNMVELLTVHEMADMLGVTSESVSRILAEFKRNDLLYKLDACSEERYAIDSRQLRREALQ
jgi:CRP/FNR family transcriptional regulator